MANGKPSTSARRRDVRRKTPQPERSIRRALRRREVTWACVFAGVLTVFATLISVFAATGPRYQEGQVLQRPVVARATFRTVNEKRTEINRQKAAEKEPPTFKANLDYLRSLRQRFGALIGMAGNQKLQDISPEYRQEIALTESGFARLKTFFRNDRPTKQWNQLTEKFLDSMFDLAILDAPRYDSEMQSDFGQLWIVRPDPPRGREATQIRQDYAWISTENTDRIREKIRQFATHFPRELQPIVESMVVGSIKPTYLYSEELTEQRRKAAAEAEPVVQETHEADQVLLPANTVLDSGDLKLLGEERAAYRATLATTEVWAGWLGSAGVILFIAAGLWGYAFAYNRRVVQNPVRGTAIVLLMLLCQATAALALHLWPQALYAGVLFPALIAAIVLAIVYDQRMAMAIGAILTLLIIVTLQLPVTLVVVMLAGVCGAVAQLHEVRTRSKLVWVGLWTGLAVGGATAVTALATRPLGFQDAYQNIAWDSLTAVGAGFAAGLLVQGVLPAIEKLFKVTTAMTLKELNDASHPLLQRLAQEAPGTYQHSLRIADMAEAAADAIGGDGLLCRVAAMYHDIGKVNKPMYFIENQRGGPNKHAKLSPAMSLLIIVGHVKDGIEMAREFGLPQVVRHFIESHHGTTLVEYFFHAARKQKEAEDKPVPSEFEFRYPGPKPRTREAAIMLLCDGVEGAARAMDEPTPVRLEQVVHAMANKRLMDGQFDECNLTLADLSRIEQAITKTLCAIYHSRIKYPGAESGEKDRKPAGAPRTQDKPRPVAAG